MYLESRHYMLIITLYYPLINLQFHTTNGLKHFVYYSILKSYEPNIIYYYIIPLKIYHDTIIFMVLFHF